MAVATQTKRCLLTFDMNRHQSLRFGRATLHATRLHSI